MADSLPLSEARLEFVYFNGALTRISLIEELFSSPPKNRTMSTRQDPREVLTTRSVLNLLRSGEGGDAPAEAQALVDGQERISEQMWRVATRQPSVQASEEHDCRAEEALLRTGSMRSGSREIITTGQMSR